MCILATTKRVFPTRPPMAIDNNIKKKENRTSGQGPNSLPGRPGDVNKWGREGEKYQPGRNNNPNNQVIQQQSDNIPGKESYSTNSFYYQHLIITLLLPYKFVVIITTIIF